MSDCDEASTSAASGVDAAIQSLMEAYRVESGRLRHEREAGVTNGSEPQDVQEAEAELAEMLIAYGASMRRPADSPERSPSGRAGDDPCYWCPFAACERRCDKKADTDDQ